MFSRCQHDLRSLAFLVLCLVFIAVTPTAAAQSYTLTDLGTLGGDESSTPTAINNRGDVVGISVDKKGISRAFYWRDGKIKHVPHFNKKHSYATGLNDLGQVVGYTVTGKDPYRAYIYDIDTDKPIELPTLPGGEQSLANSINNSGQVVGRCSGNHHHEYGDNAHGEHAFRYKDGTITDLQDLINLERFGGIRSDAVGINRFGYVAGHFYTSAHIGYSRGYFYKDGDEPIALGTLGGGNTIVAGINDADQVVGYSETQSGKLRAFVWDRIHGMLIINPPPGGSQSLAYDINNRGEVVGAFDSTDGQLHAFLYRGGNIRDLNNLIPANSGWKLVKARAINDDGQIVGDGVIGGERRAFLLTPRP